MRMLPNKFLLFVESNQQEAMAQTKKGGFKSSSDCHIERVEI